MNEKEWQLILTNSRETVYKKGQVILREGTINDRIFVLKKGRVVITKQFTNKKVVMWTMTDEGFFGEQSLFGPSPLSTSVEADSDHVKIAEIETTFVTNLFRLPQQYAIAMKFYKNLAMHSVNRIRTFPSAFKLVGDVKNEGIVRFNASCKAVNSHFFKI